MRYTVTFWGTRGSIPTPGPHTARYGGNTPCVAVEGSGGQLVILDAGTGIRALGLVLVERQNGAVNAEILLSHAHWDHIQGLPHFKPFFAPGNAVRIWGSRQGAEHRVRDGQRAGAGRALRHPGFVAAGPGGVSGERGAPDPRRDVHAAGARAAPRVGPLHIRRGGGPRRGRRRGAARAVPSRARA